MRAAWIFALAGLCCAAAPAAASPIDGLWLTDDHKGVVRIGPCGEGVCGWIVRVLDNRPGVPTRDVNNPLRVLRNRPIIGLAVLTGFTANGTEYSGGTAYDPKAGRAYRATLRLRSGNALDVTGCVLFICRTVAWTRTR
jgi:uncharacterized protein (DUF2147 family)